MTKFFNKLTNPILGLPRTAKCFVALVTDMGLCVLTVWLAYYLRLGEFVGFVGHGLWASGQLWASLVSMAIALPIFTLSGLYRAIFRYNGWPALLSVARAVGIYGLLYAALFTAIGIVGIPRTVGIIQPLLLLVLVGASRLLVRFWLGEEYRRILQRATLPKVVIYGAGTTGRQLMLALAHSQEMQVVGFLDDDDRLHGHMLNGLTIHAPADLQILVKTKGIDDVLLAMPRISRQRRNQILELVRAAQVAVRTVPSLQDLAQGKISVADLRELDIDDLLGREAVRANHILLAKNIDGRVVLVTGAGGSIGSELCRQILTLAPTKLLLIEQSEFALYTIHQELRKAAERSATVLVPLLASVQDDDRMREIMFTWHPDTVYHAAAYKHVPIVEHNPAAGIKNNVLGTLCAARAAAANGVADFVLISTDKAVRPTNVMGASKRLAEMALQALAAEPFFPGPSPAGRRGGPTRFSMVRFGNVLGSSGSVVPKFRQQIRDGGPVTLTHPEVTRYFMTIPEAAQLVIQAGAMAKGGEVFVLDMGRPVKILDLARRMIELSGLAVRDAQRPDGDIEVAVIGLRPGEKLYEELLIGDNPKPTLHPRIMQAHEDFLPWNELKTRLDALEMALNVNDVGAMRLMLQQLVGGYRPEDEIVDWVYLEQGNAGLSSG